MFDSLHRPLLTLSAVLGVLCAIPAVDKLQAKPSSSVVSAPPRPNPAPPPPKPHPQPQPQPQPAFRPLPSVGTGPVMLPNGVAVYPTTPGYKSTGLTVNWNNVSNNSINPFGMNPFGYNNSLNSPYGFSNWNMNTLATYNPFAFNTLNNPFAMNNFNNPFMFSNVNNPFAFNNLNNPFAFNNLNNNPFAFNNLNNNPFAFNNLNNNPFAFNNLNNNPFAFNNLNNNPFAFNNLNPMMNNPFNPVNNAPNPFMNKGGPNLLAPAPLWNAMPGPALMNGVGPQLKMGFNGGSGM